MTGDEIESRTGGVGVRSGASASGWSYRPRIDVTEDPDEFTLRADMPGATAENIRIEFENRILRIHGAVPMRQPRDVEYLTHEFGIGDFDRELVLSDTVDPDRICAEYEHGVLIVHLPKCAEAKPRRIPVRTT